MGKFSSERDAFLNFLKEIVELESNSNAPEKVNKLVEHLDSKFKEIGAQTKVLEGAPHGNHLFASWGGGQEKLLLLCHMDTVWKTGTIETMPFKVEGNRVSGPGVFDMKSGIVFAWFVLKAFNELSQKPNKQINVLMTSDEETGSETAEKYIKEYANGCKAVLVLEPAGENGGIKTFRKGLGMVKVYTKGRAAHAGLDHQNGRSAVKELANLILKAEALTNYDKGTTVNVGVIKGGTAENVVPAEAYAEIDFRFTEKERGLEVEKFFKEYKPVVEDVKVEVQGGIDRDPMLRTSEVVKLYELAKKCAGELNIDLTEYAAGGVSDGNFTSALGIPTLDGLGPVGGGAHAADEHILVDESLQRMELLHNFILAL